MLLIHDGKGVDNVTVFLNMETVPAILTFIKGEEKHNFYLTGDSVDGCDQRYQYEVEKWLHEVHDQLLDIIWQWNLGKDEVELIYDKLMLD